MIKSSSKMKFLLQWTLVLSVEMMTIQQVRSSSSSSSSPGIEVKGMLDELPDTGEEWISLTESGMEFQPAPGLGEDDHPDMASIMAEAKQRFLVHNRGSHSGYENQFIDGAGSYYNDYSQAWRLLGFYTDCNAPRNNYNECDDDGRRRDLAGSSSAGAERDLEDEGGSVVACQRFLLWAAYIDLDYSDGGIGEYQFFNRHTKSWDSTSCVAGNGRCAKMDCHLKDTNWKLLGFFKEPNYHEWMEQLFKHQGVCLWTNNEYNFMQTDRYLWPCDCTSTGEQDADGNTLYYDTKPMPEGRIGIGLYTDSRCKFDYSGPKDIMDVLDGDVSDLQQNLESWNDAFDVFKICQPCKAYNLGYNTDLNEGGGDRQGGDDAYGAFDCYDDADYLNVNQCMKFKTKTEMIAADFRDLMLAHQQGNIVEFEVMGLTYGYGGFRTGQMESQFTMSGIPQPPISLIAFFFGSLVFMLFSACCYFRIRSQNRARASRFGEPLV